MQVVNVELGANSYDIFIGENIFSEINNFIASYSKKILVITDANVYKTCASNFINNFEVAIIPAGETSKNLRAYHIPGVIMCI